MSRNKQLNTLEIVMTLAESNSVADCAKRLGVTRNTIYNYKRDPNIREYLNRLTDLSLSQISGELSAKNGLYVSNIESLANNDSTPIAVKLDCYKTLLQYCLTTVDKVNILQRLERLESNG